MAYLICGFGFSIAVRRNERIEHAVVSMAKWFMPLSIFYLALDFIAAGILLIRIVI